MTQIMFETFNTPVSVIDLQLWNFELRKSDMW